MKANTAIGFLLAGLALWLQRNELMGARARYAGRFCAVMVALLGLLTLNQILSGHDFGIDNALFPETAATSQTAPPGQMSPATAFNFLLAGLALLVLDIETRRGWRPAQWLILPPLAVSFVAVLGYVYGAEKLYRIGGFTSIALHTALAFSLLGLGLFWIRPTRGIMALVTSDTLGGMLVRRLLPVVLLAVPLLFWFRLLGEQAGYYGTEFGISLMALATITLLGGSFWWSAHAINRWEATRRNVEQQLHESETRFAVTFEQAAVGIALVAPDGRWLRVNRRLCEIIGYDKEELLTKTFQDVTHPDDLDADLGQVRRMLAKEIDTYSMEKRYFRKDGAIVWINLTVALTWREDGAPDYFISVVEDIQARKAAEAQLRKLSLVVEQSPESVVITDLDANIEYVNEAFVRNTGYSHEEVIGQNPRILASGKTSPEDHKAMWNALTGGQIWQGELINKRKDGSDYVDFAVIAPLRQPDGTITHYVGVQEDITERKRIGAELDCHRHHLEQLVMERTAQLEQAKLRAEAATQAKGAFLANMSHEIRTPLNAVLGFARIGVRENPGRKTGETCQQILNAGRHLLGVINDILDFSKIEAGKLTVERVPFQPAAIIANLRSFVAGAASDKGLDFRVETARPLPDWLLGDPLRLQQILANLLSNAVKFTASGAVRLVVSCAGDETRFSVIDQGIGMTEEQVGRLFQPFEQADSSTTRQFGGTGLGLAISRQLAELMGGVIGVTSAPGQGSTFTLTLSLPETEPPEHAAVEEESALAGRQLNGVRILAAEDVEVNRLILADILDQAGATYVLVEDGEQAVEQVAHNKGAFDAVLMDVQMPVMDGYEATRRIRELAPDLPVIGLTAHSFAEERAKCVSAGMVEQVTKPVDPETLYAMLHKWLPREFRTEAHAAAKPERAQPVLTDGVVDLSVPLRSLNNKVDKVRRLIDSFIASARGDLPSIEQALAERDWPTLKSFGHRLKSPARSLGMAELGRLYEELEHCQDEEGASRAEKIIDQIGPLLAHITTALEQDPRL